ncbi:DUF6082 family protein [Streptomyces caeni]|uniref:DUF6082 family protein n=1 Tax=Streptomyces caeni TaxID=2307231 RepID=A0ABW4IPL1_9ACTN
MVTRKLGLRGPGSAATGLVLAAGALAVLTRQQRRCIELRLQIEQQRMHFHLLSKAIDDPELAAVMSTVDLSSRPEPERPRLRRQYLFANALYTHALQSYLAGYINWQELHGHLRVLCQSHAVREYWEATRHHRDSLARASTEAHVGRMMDRIVRDLDDADTDEWWVVGQPLEE